MLQKLLANRHLVRWVLGIHFLVWMILAQFVSATPDMADHWVWSRSLQLSYYEHPPMIALFFRFFSLFLGDSPWAVKMASLITNTFVVYLAFRLCKSFFNQVAANIFLLILLVTPYFTAGSLFMNIDQPYMIFWLVNLWFMKRYIETDNPKWLLAVGVGAGFGALSKYITVFFYVGLGVWALVRSEQRAKFFKRVHIYLAGMVSLLLFSPVLIWNYQNNWVSFRFQFGKGLGGGALGERFLPFTLGHLGLFSLVFTLLFWVFLCTKKRNLWKMSAQESLLVVTGMVPFVFFTIFSFRGSIADPHWVNVSYLGFFMLFSDFLAKELASGALAYETLALRYWAAGALNVGFIALFFLQGYFQVYKISPEIDPVVRTFGWDVTAKQIDQLLEERGWGVPDFVLSEGYQLSGVLSLYLKGQPLSFSYTKIERNQWSPIDSIKSSKSIMACAPSECAKFLRNLTQRYQLKLTPLGQVDSYFKDRRYRTLSIYDVKP